MGTSKLITLRHIYYLSLLLSSSMLSFSSWNHIGAPYLAISDADLLYVGQAIMLNSGLEQTYFDHTGYFYMLLLSFWFKLGNVLGLVSGITFDDLAQSTNLADFLGPLVYAGRIFTLILSYVFMIVTGQIVRSITKSYFYASLYTILMGTSLGLFIHVIQIRAELLNAFMFAVSVFCLYKSQDLANNSWLFPAACGFFTALALFTKIQIIAGLLCLPLVGVVWGVVSERTNRERLQPLRTNGLSGFIGLKDPNWPLRLVLSTLVVLLFILSSGVYIDIYLKGQIFSPVPYQMDCFNYLLVAFVLYVVLRLQPWFATLMGVMLFNIGMCIGLSLYFVEPQPRNIYAITNFMEHAKYFIHEQDPALMNQRFLYGVKQTLMGYINISQLIEKPLGLLNVLFLFIISFFVFLREQRWVLVMAFSFAGIGIALESVTYMRYHHGQYLIYFEFFYILSFLYLCSHLFRLARDSVMFSVLGKYERTVLIAVVILVSVFQMRVSTGSFEAGGYGGISFQQFYPDFCHDTVYTPALREYIEERSTVFGSCEEFVKADLEASVFYRLLRPIWTHRFL